MNFILRSASRETNEELIKSYPGINNFKHEKVLYDGHLRLAITINNLDDFIELKSLVGYDLIVSYFYCFSDEKYYNSLIIYDSFLE